MRGGGFVAPAMSLIRERRARPIGNCHIRPISSAPLVQALLLSSSSAPLVQALLLSLHLLFSNILAYRSISIITFFLLGF